MDRAGAESLYALFFLVTLGPSSDVDTNAFAMCFFCLQYDSSEPLLSVPSLRILQHLLEPVQTQYTWRVVFFNSPNIFYILWDFIRNNLTKGAVVGTALTLIASWFAWRTHSRTRPL